MAKEELVTPTVFRIDVIPRLENGQTNGRSYIQAAHQLGYTQLQDCHVTRIYFLQGTLTKEEVIRIASEILADPVTEKFRINNSQFTIHNSQFIIHNSQFTIH